MPQEKPMAVLDKLGNQIGVRGSQLINATSSTRTKSITEQKEEEAAAQAAADKQRVRDRALEPSEQVKGALRRATGFPTYSSVKN